MRRARGSRDLFDSDKRDVPDGQSTYTSDRGLMNSPSAKNQHHRSNHRDYRFPDTIEDSRRYPNQRGEEIGYFPKAKHILNDSENDDGRATGLGRAGRNDGGAAAAGLDGRFRWTRALGWSWALAKAGTAYAPDLTVGLTDDLSSKLQAPGWRCWLQPT